MTGPAGRGLFVVGGDTARVKRFDHEGKVDGRF